MEPGRAKTRPTSVVWQHDTFSTILYTTYKIEKIDIQKIQIYMVNYHGQANILITKPLFTQNIEIPCRFTISYLKNVFVSIIKKTIFQYKGNIMIKTSWPNWTVNIENNWLICYWQNMHRKSWKGHSNYQSYISWSAKHVELVVNDISNVMKCVIDKTQIMAGLHLPIKQHHTMRPLQLP